MKVFRSLSLLFIAALSAQAKTKSCRNPADLFTSLDVVVGAQQESVGDDRASLMTFGPGPGTKNKDPRDFIFSLELKDSLNIKTLTISHNVCGEAWSTASREKYHGNGGLFPLVLVQDSEPLNKDYDTPVTAHVGSLHLYMQPETPIFTGGMLFVETQDGCEYRIPIGTPTGCALERSGSAAIAITKDPKGAIVFAHAAPPEVKKPEKKPEVAKKDSKPLTPKSGGAIKSGSSFLIVNCVTEKCP